MAWGAPRGVDDLVTKLKSNNTATTMCILSTRKFGPTEAVAFSAALADNTSLRELLASGHPLGAAEAAAFGQAMSRNTTLRSLCVGDNDFGDEGVLALVEGLQFNSGLLVLDLEYKSIASGEGLGVLLRTHRTLADLRLGRNQLGESGIKALSVGLSRNSKLLRLDLSGNMLNAAAAETLGCALSRAAPSAAHSDGDGGEGASCGTNAGPPPLEYLDVSKNPLGDEGGAAFIEALTGTGCGAASSLTSLRMAEAGLGAASAAALARALAPRITANPGATGEAPGVTARATALDRGAVSADKDKEDGFGEGKEEGLAAAAAAAAAAETATGTTCAVRGLPLLKVLDLSNNELGAGGAKDLAGALGRGGAPQLESLSMGYNSVGDEGAVALGRAARAGLRVLDLSGNALSGAGMRGALSTPGLREAKLFHNACADEGVPLVLDAITVGGSLETLDLGANGLTGAGLETLLQGLAACSSLQTLEVGANSNDDRAEAAVRNSQANNPGLDIAFRRGGEAMEGSGAPPNVLDGLPTQGLPHGSGGD